MDINLKNYQLACLDSFTSNTPAELATNLRSEDILSLYNILYLKKLEYMSQLMKNNLDFEVIEQLRLRQLHVYENNKKQFPAELKEKIKSILQNFQTDQNLMKTRKELNKLSNDIEDDDVFRTLNFVGQLVYEVSPAYVPISESRLNPAFIHNEMIAIFKLDINQAPPISNVSPELQKWRPDSKIIPFKDAAHIINEVVFDKDEDENDDLKNKKDTIKIAIYSKCAFHDNKSNLCLSYAFTDNTFRFFSSKHYKKDIYFFVEFEALSIPSSVLNITTVTESLDQFLSLSSYLRSN